MIDTAAKRRMAAGVPFLPLTPGVTPNVSKTAAWRRQAAWSYSGALADADAGGETRMSHIYLCPRRVT